MTPPFATDFTGPEESPGFLLWQVSNLWQRKQRAALKALDLTHVQFVLLANTAWHTHQGQQLTQAQLAHHAQIDVMMTSQVLRTLEEKGLVHREAHPRDTRANLLSVTPAGLETATRAVALAEGVDRAFFGQLHEHTGQLTALLKQLLEE